MADRVLLALTSSSEGDPACLLDHAGQPVIARLVEQLDRDGEVAVVTWDTWVDAVRAAVPAETVVHGVRSHGDAVRALATGAGAGVGAGAGAGGDLVVAHAHLVANDLALGRVADAAARGTAAVIAPGAPAGTDAAPAPAAGGSGSGAGAGGFGSGAGAGSAPPRSGVGPAVDVGGFGSVAGAGSAPPRWDGMPVRVTRGRVVAAGSAHHTLGHPTGRCLRTLRIGAGDLPAATPLLTELADLLDRWAPATEPAPVTTSVAASVATSETEGPVGGAGVDAWDDLVAFVLVALVRGGVAVSATGLPTGSVWRHPRSPAAVTEAVAAVAALDEERQRLDAAVKADDGFFTTFFVSSYSRYWARWAARRGLTPNQVTSVSMLLGILAAAAFAVGTRPWAVVGAITLQLAFTLDCVDGQLARYSRRFSALGAWLDSVFDRGKEYVVYAGLAVGGLRAGEDGLWLLAGAALALQTFRHTLDLGYAEQQLADVDAAVIQPLDVPAERGPSFWEATPDPAGPALRAVPEGPALRTGPEGAEPAPAQVPDHGGADGGPVQGRGGAEPAPAQVPDHGATAHAPASVAAAAGGPAEATRQTAASLPRRIIGWLRRAEGVSVLRWAKRIVVLPIGERFALISVVSVVAGPRAVFVALLVWGGLATAYTAGGRVVRSIA